MSSDSGFAGWWKVFGGAVVGLTTVTLSLWFGGPLQDRWARMMWDDEAEATVRQLLDDLAAVGHAAPEEQADLMDEVRTLVTEDVDDETWDQWTVGSDPYVWTRVRLDSADETRSAAVVGAPSGTVWAIRRAKSGCWELRGDFELARTRGQWRISRLPEFRRRCRPKTMAATWHGADERRGVIDWPGTYQRVDPSSTSFSQPSAVLASANSERAWSARKSTDIENVVDEAGYLEYDGDLKTAWGAERPLADGTWGTLTYEFAEPVRLLRIRLRNGARPGPRYEEHGRIRTATLTAGDSAVAVALKSRPGSQRVDCDFGVVDAVSLTITGAFPRLGATVEDTDVALSHIDFWGLPAAAEVEQPPPAGAFAWSDAYDRPADREDVAPCRSDPPPLELVADPAPAPTTETLE